MRVTNRGEVKMASQSSESDESAKRFKLKKNFSSEASKLLKTNQMAPLPPYAQEKSPVEESLNKKNMTVTEVMKMIEKYRKMHDQLDRQLDEVYQKSGFTPRQIQDYLANPNNFNEQEWERIQKKRQEFEKSFNVKKEGGLAKPLLNQQFKETKPRRTKNVGVRRNWIEVR